MNYVIMGPERSGTSFLGDLLKLHGLPYFNELFTPEICRTVGIWPLHLERQHVDQRIDLAFSVQNSGFKLPYSHTYSGVWALTNLARRCEVLIIHIFRDNLLEQLASWTYLNRAGVSMTMKGGTQWNTDGVRVWSLNESPPYHMPPEEVEAHFMAMEASRMTVHKLFSHDHSYHEMPMCDVFTLSGQREVLKFLGATHKGYDPKQIPTVRPKASEMFSNFEELRLHFDNTRWGKWFASDAVSNV